MTTSLTLPPRLLVACLWFSLAMCAGQSACASVQNMGTWGTVWSIEEVDAIDEIKAKLATMKRSGEMDRIQKEWQNKAFNRIQKGPEPVPGLHKAATTRTRIFDPTVRLDENITDQKGRVIALAGTQINPLTVTPLKRDYILFDGTDPDQVRWAIGMTRIGRPPTLILTNGSPVQLMAEYPNVRIYFDQFGQISKRLHVTTVPSLIRQVGDKLEITERAL